MLSNGRSARRPRAIVGSATPLFASALSLLLDDAGFDAGEPAGDAPSARSRLLAGEDEVAVLDYAGSTPSGLDLLRDARAAGVGARIVLFCGEDGSDDALDAVELGVDGLLLRSAVPAAARACIAAVARGEQWLDPQAMKAAYDRLGRRHAVSVSPLTRRERDVARLVAAGQRNRVIAGELGISEGTVKMHLHNVYSKLGLESRTQLAMDMRVRDAA